MVEVVKTFACCGEHGEDSSLTQSSMNYRNSFGYFGILGESILLLIFVFVRKPPLKYWISCKSYSKYIFLENFGPTPTSLPYPYFE